MFKNKFSVKISDVLFWCTGAAVYTVAVTVILEPNMVSPGGFTGIAALVNTLFGIPTGLVLLILNVPLIVLEYRKFGGGFIFKTAAATFILSFFLSLGEKFLKPFHTDPMLAGIFGGLLSGLGLGLVLLRGATTGGVDVIAKLVNAKFPHFSVGRVIMISDVLVIIAAALVYGNLNAALYSVIAIFASSRIIDGFLYGSDKGKLMLIVTDVPNKVSKAVFENLKRGMTEISVKGSYTKNKKYMLLAAVRQNEAGILHRSVISADPESFVIVLDAGEITGHGFKRM